jgi:alcohol dehydrogenase class IV
MVLPFSFAPIPHIHFGRGSIQKIGDISAKFGGRVLLITGGGSLKRSGKLDEIAKALAENKIEFVQTSVRGEPSPGLVDETVVEFKKRGIDAVLAVGGGSVVDFGKAVSAMMIPGARDGVSVTEFLEGVGNKTHGGEKLPFIAVPTTSGTGSEATKNAVLSEVGEAGFKKSIRHDNFVPDVAVIDPELTLSCPPDVTAACGMDALTQLLESYFSTKASPMTDALAMSGIEAVGKGLVTAVVESPGDLDAREGMAYGALLSGITLANAGLGLVHGVASFVGGFFDIPHGVVCANLMGPAMRETLDALKNDGAADEEERRRALKKFAVAGAALNLKDISKENEIGHFPRLLVDRICELVDMLEIPRFGKYGITEVDVEKITTVAENKNNPVTLPKDVIANIIRERL